ncbi:MAG: LptA/OstA family protein [Bullifex sp.]|nr:LptA/OstA family protein [Spirochaetales bacterium]MDY2816421.1 LptA/OstA family protein [Bullifex sp.]MDD7007725.1 LptA/OstA family protein [Spirochaetales bacterium]MDD7536752.1 LptA/OstA family protein [Spirochaetales bacterium]MDY3850321.1 LptA/OstA family protein [Bullifex sp.]
MKKITVLLALILTVNVLFSAPVTFSGGYSKVSLKEGRRSVSLTGGATVSAEGMVITADSVTLTGDDYDVVECTGTIEIKDEEKGLSIKTTALYYDRTAERLLISAWCEVSDSVNELEAGAGAVSYDLRNEVLSLEMAARLMKATDSGLLSARAERITFDRGADTLTLQGNAEVEWNRNSYRAKLITINLTTEEIRLEGRIEGEVHG